ncbi:MAG: hypothetical protein MJZ89_05660 [Paludibacteraceae bacterium]|nr:hypothetical protein [Paludibacteraceae bacterium]
MKRLSSIHPFTIALCLLVVFGLMASIAAVFPPDGITIRYPGQGAETSSASANSTLQATDPTTETSFDLTTRKPFEYTFRSPALDDLINMTEAQQALTCLRSLPERMNHWQHSHEQMAAAETTAGGAHETTTVAPDETDTTATPLATTGEEQPSLATEPGDRTPQVGNSERTNLEPVSIEQIKSGTMANDAAERAINELLAAQKNRDDAESVRLNCLALPDAHYLDSFFIALEHAHEQRVRVVHFGDSQLEEDRMSCDLRLALQERYGGGGNGLLPWQHELYSQTVLLTSPVKPKQHMIYGPKSGRRPNSSMYGPMGKVSLLDSTMTVTISPKKRDGQLTSAHFFNQLTVLTYSNSDMRLRAQNQSVTIEPNSVHLQRTTVNLDDSTSTVRITLSGNGDVYGFMLDNQTGVSVDNIPMRGCSGTVFTSLDARQLYGYLHTDEVRLIIMQFGGNSVPYLKDAKSISNYVEQLRHQLQLMRRIAPQAAFLWVGPSDMTTRVNGHMVTYPSLQQIDASICQMVLDEGCAYFSLFQAMGGPGSMVRWVEQSPALASKDYIHFTRRGATRAGQLLTEAILSAAPDAQGLK